jgi:F-type H+-transporting ATPase subunit delta
MASASGNSEIARRYARALFELAREQNAVDAVEADLTALASMLASSDDLARLADDATLKRKVQEAAMLAVADAAQFSPLTRNLLGTLAQKRRLPALAAVIAAAQDRIAEHKGETTATVVVARALDKAQVDAVAAALKKALGLNVKVNVIEDPSIMGGLVVRVGSMLIDSSVRTRLDRLTRALKSQDRTEDQKKMKEVA